MPRIILRPLSLAVLFLLNGHWAIGQEVTVDRDPAERVVLFRRPGLDLLRCRPGVVALTKCVDQDQVGYPNGAAKVQLIRDAKTGRPNTYNLEGEHPYTKEYLEETWYEVEATYVFQGKTETKRGWLHENQLKFTNPKVASIKSLKEKQPCPPQNNRKNPNRKEVALRGQIEETLAEVQKQIIAPSDKAVEKAANALYGVIGQCTYNPPLTQPKPNWTDQRPLYDQEVMPIIKANAKRLPMISAQAGVNITERQLIDIDMLSRTLYGEMAKCSYRGPQYMQMVARVVMNRAQFDQNYLAAKGQKSEFTAESNFFSMNHRADESPIQAVLNSAKKFNNWDLYFYKRDKSKKVVKVFNESGVTHALCPPASPNVYWGSHLATPGIPKVGSEELGIWSQVSKIATEAVLFPEQFKAKTNNLHDVLLFQSKIHSRQNMSVFNGRPRVNRSVQGRPVNVDTCAVIYESEKWQMKYLGN